MANRGAAYGIAAQVQCKLTNKRDIELENEILLWMSEIIGEPLPRGELGDVLRNGVYLCKLMNRLDPSTCTKINNTNAPFKIMENIDHFLRAARKYGVSEIDLFQSVDLVEKRNIPGVVQCLMAIGRCGYLHPEFRGPYLGPKPAEESKRDFSEETLIKGKTVINLQYGTNKGANQQGLNFGNFRHM
ncbi:muscle-specific protein 20 [Tetranychus urticae]|nr:muscle-specific protein 20 [Tetranychus urticae]XP_025018480.1 muscle-specific protein 20 [Tetranychus urticae]